MLPPKYINITVKNSNIFKYSQAGPFLLRYCGPIPSQTAPYKPGQANLNPNGTPRVRNIHLSGREGTCFCSAPLEYLTWERDGHN